MVYQLPHSFHPEANELDMTARKEQMKQSIVQEVSDCDYRRPQSQVEYESGLTIQLAVANAQQLINKINDNVNRRSC